MKKGELVWISYRLEQQNWIEKEHIALQMVPGLMEEFQGKQLNHLLAYIWS